MILQVVFGDDKSDDNLEVDIDGVKYDGNCFIFFV